MKLTNNISVFNQDCMEGMRDTPDNYYDLAIVDPPYGIGMSGGKWGNSKVDFKNFEGNDDSIPDEAYFKELIRVSNNYIVWGGNYMTDYLPPKSCFIVWDKVQPEKFSMAMAELAITSFESPAKIIRKRVVGSDLDGKTHPTQKPVFLYNWLLENYAKKGQKILDTHGGSMSSAIAFHYWSKGEGEMTLYELDKDYYDSAIKRFKEYQSKYPLEGDTSRESEQQSLF